VVNLNFVEFQKSEGCVGHPWHFLEQDNSMYIYVCVCVVKNSSVLEEFSSWWNEDWVATYI